MATTENAATTENTATDEFIREDDAPNDGTYGMAKIADDFTIEAFFDEFGIENELPAGRVCADLEKRKVGKIIEVGFIKGKEKRRVTMTQRTRKHYAFEEDCCVLPEKDDLFQHTEEGFWVKVASVTVPETKSYDNTIIRCYKLTKKITVKSAKVSPKSATKNAPKSKSAKSNSKSAKKSATETAAAAEASPAAEAVPETPETAGAATAVTPETAGAATAVPTPPGILRALYVNYVTLYVNYAYTLRQLCMHSTSIMHALYVDYACTLRQLCMHSTSIMHALYVDYACPLRQSCMSSTSDSQMYT